jgi:hypothetical protein
MQPSFALKRDLNRPSQPHLSDLPSDLQMAGSPVTETQLH